MEQLKGMKSIFFIGIGGIGMSALAVILKERGFSVSGSDRSESSTVKNLRERGITVTIGHSAANITAGIDAVVFTNAVSEDNPELAAARESNLAVFERAAMLDILAKSRFSIGVSGTHGKTTTTSMVSKIFLRAGMSPSLAIGGHIDEIGGSGFEGKGRFFIYEACEAYASFLKLHPDMALVTNIDADHLDFYHSFEAIEKAFETYVTENVPPRGRIIYNRDDAPLRRLMDRVCLRNAVSVGIDSRDADFRASEVRLGEFSSSFTVIRNGARLGEFYLNVPGVHNVTNALLAIAAGVSQGISAESMMETLSHFKNADRRFQLKLDKEGLIVIDDYAHHPSEIEATLNAAANLADKKKAQLIAVFQPHLYSRTEFLYKDFARTLALADQVVLTEIYAARETNEHNISARIIFDEIVRLKGDDKVYYSRELCDVPSVVKPLLNGQDIIITLGAGDVWKVSEMFNAN